MDVPVAEKESRIGEKLQPRLTKRLELPLKDLKESQDPKAFEWVGGMETRLSTRLKAAEEDLMVDGIESDENFLLLTQGVAADAVV